MLPRNPLTAVLIAFVLALGVNLWYFITGTDLSMVVSRTIFADLLLVLSMVPIYESMRLKLTSDTETTPNRIKAGMKAVLIYALLLAVATFILFKLFGDPLVGERISLLREMLDASPDMTEELKQQRIETARSIYSPGTHTLAVIIGTLFTGLISSVLAAVVVRR